MRTRDIARAGPGPAAAAGPEPHGGGGADVGLPAVPPARLRRSVTAGAAGGIAAGGWPGPPPLAAPLRAGSLRAGGAGGGLPADDCAAGRPAARFPRRTGSLHGVRLSGR